jgi:hypothetical protein
MDEPLPIILTTDIIGYITEIISSPCFASRRTYLSWYSTNRRMFNKLGDATELLKIWRLKLEQIKIILAENLCGNLSKIYNSYLKDISVLTTIVNIEKFLSEYTKKQIDTNKPVEQKVEIIPTIVVSQENLGRVNHYLIAKMNWYLGYFSDARSFSTSPKIYLTMSK